MAIRPGQDGFSKAGPSKSRGHSEFRTGPISKEWISGYSARQKRRKITGATVDGRPSKVYLRTPAWMS